MVHPNKMDSKKLNNFKSRAHVQQETFNGRLKFFNAFAQTFRHGFKKHGIVLRAVAETVQHQMDNGSLICSIQIDI